MKKLKSLSIRLSEDEYEMLSSNAKQVGVSKARYIALTSCINLESVQMQNQYIIEACARISTEVNWISKQYPKVNLDTLVNEVDKLWHF